VVMSAPRGVRRMRGQFISRYAGAEVGIIFAGAGGFAVKGVDEIDGGACCSGETPLAFGYEDRRSPAARLDA